MSEDTHAPFTCCGTVPPIVALVPVMAARAESPWFRAR